VTVLTTQRGNPVHRWAELCETASDGLFRIHRFLACSFRHRFLLCTTLNVSFSTRLFFICHSQGQNTTTEFLSHAIHGALAKRLPSFVGTLKVRVPLLCAWDCALGVLHGGILLVCQKQGVWMTDIGSLATRSFSVSHR